MTGNEKTERSSARFVRQSSDWPYSVGLSAVPEYLQIHVALLCEQVESSRTSLPSVKPNVCSIVE